MAEHGSLEIPLIDATTDEQTEQATEEPVPQGEKHLVKSDRRSAARRTARSERRSSFFTPQPPWLRLLDPFRPLT